MLRVRQVDVIQDLLAAGVFLVVANWCFSVNNETAGGLDERGPG